MTRHVEFVATDKDDVASKIIINRAGDMTQKGRKNIAEWLRFTADALESDGKEYAKLFKATYFYPVHKKKVEWKF